MTAQCRYAPSQQFKHNKRSNFGSEHLSFLGSHERRIFKGTIHKQNEVNDKISNKMCRLLTDVHNFNMTNKHDTLAHVIKGYIWLLIQLLAMETMNSPCYSCSHCFQKNTDLKNLLLLVCNITVAHGSEQTLSNISIHRRLVKPHHKLKSIISISSRVLALLNVLDSSTWRLAETLLRGSRTEWKVYRLNNECCVNVNQPILPFFLSTLFYLVSSGHYCAIFFPNFLPPFSACPPPSLFHFISLPANNSTLHGFL